MSDSLIYGSCDSCDKKYKVPSADKSYPCKACGGTVWVHEMHEERTASERFNARRKTRSHLGARIGGAVGILALGVALIGYQVGAFGTAFGSDVDSRLYETNIEQVDAAVVENWSGGDVEALTAMHHPTGQGEFATRLSRFGDVRGWGTAWPALEAHKGSLEGGTEAAPEKGVTVAKFGDSFLRIRWQYDGNVERWFIYNFWLSPTELSPRVEEFRTAWTKSDTAALRPLFGESRADKLQELFDKRIEKKDWTGAHPKLGTVQITGEEFAQNPTGEFFGNKVESVFEFDGDTVTIRWRFDQATDEWIVSGLGF